MAPALCVEFCHINQMFNCRFTLLKMQKFQMWTLQLFMNGFCSSVVSLFLIVKLNKLGLHRGYTQFQFGLYAELQTFSNCWFITVVFPHFGHNHTPHCTNRYRHLGSVQLTSLFVASQLLVWLCAASKPGACSEIPKLCNCCTFPSPQKHSLLKQNNSFVLQYLLQNSQLKVSSNGIPF